MKRTYSIAALFALIIVTGCASTAPFHHEFASGHYSKQIVQCVPYARQVSGIELYGDANDWWYKARGNYDRGHMPKPGSVLVLKATSRMSSGHVAVVRRVITSRLITVTHSNWGSDSHSRHIIYDSMRAEDVSENNDWSEVRFWNDDKNVMGFPYAAYGFIYP